MTKIKVETRLVKALAKAMIMLFSTEQLTSCLIKSASTLIGTQDLLYRMPRKMQ